MGEPVSRLHVEGILNFLRTGRFTRHAEYGTNPVASGCPHARAELSGTARSPGSNLASDSGWITGDGDTSSSLCALLRDQMEAATGLQIEMHLSRVTRREGLDQPPSVVPQSGTSPSHRISRSCCTLISSLERAYGPYSQASRQNAHI